MCRSRRAKLDSAGFIVFEGMLDQSRTRNEWYGAADSSPSGDGDGLGMDQVEKEVSLVFDTITKYISGPDLLALNHKVPWEYRKRWCIIRNQSEQNKVVMDLESRLMTNG